MPYGVRVRVPCRAPRTPHPEARLKGYSLSSNSLKPYAWLSIAAALATMLLKTVAWSLTGSVGLLSDALESLVNLAGAVVALWMIALAERPADEDHPHGHNKAEYFSSGFEGLLIILAALGISHAAIERLLNPQPLEAVSSGLIISFVASAINYLVAQKLLKAGKQYQSITLEADAQHLMSDVWTSAAVILGVTLAALSNWHWLDPLIALAVVVHIAWTGWQLVHQSASGLMDVALPAEDLQKITAVLEQHRIAFHALRTRRAGRRSFISVHLLVPGFWSVQHAHDQAEQIERAVRQCIPGSHITTHMEPLDDPSSMEDQTLDRNEAAPL